MLSIKVVFFLLIFFGFPAFSKYQVCSLTINSSDEIRTFRKHLPKEDFDFVELVPQGVTREAHEVNDYHWFDKACQKDYKCDILVISGHFGGLFFGESGYSLPTQILEEAACRESCSGILSQAKEVFLFGCNTLSSKEKDLRTFEEYLQVLLEDGMAREMAERVVSARYSPLETSFQDRMKFIFEGSQTLYGFQTLSPLGKYAAPLLDQYFKSIKNQYGSYRSYLDQEAHLNKNLSLFNLFNHTSLSQVSSTFSPAKRNVETNFLNKCLLYDEQASFDKRVQAFNDLFLNDQALNSFFAIDYFLDQHGSKISKGEWGSVYSDLKKEKTYVEKYFPVYKQLKKLPYIQIVYLNFLKKFAWVDQEFFDQSIRNNVLELIQNPDSEVYETLLLLLSRSHIKPRQFYFSKDELKSGFVNSIWSLLILEKLQLETPFLQEEVIDFCRKNIDKDLIICYQALNTLAHMRPTNKAKNFALFLLNHFDDGVVYYALRVLGQSNLTSLKFHLKLSEFLNHKNVWVRQEALDSLAFLKTPYTEVHQLISKGLKGAEKNKGLKLLKTLSHFNIQDDKVLLDIIEYLRKNSRDIEIRKKVLGSFTQTEPLSESVLNVFYGALESKDFELVHFTIQLIAKMSVQDMGLDYRISLLILQSSNDVKKAFLEALDSLSWIHPEVQYNWVLFLLNEDKRVRELAVDVFRNVKNWSHETKEKVRELSDKNIEIKEVIEEF